MAINTFFVGNVGGEADLRYLPDGSPVLSFSVANNERVKEKDGNYHDHVTWLRVSFFGKRAEGLSKVLSKGSYVAVNGTLSIREYEKDGQKRTSLDVRAYDVSFAGGKRDNASGDAGGGAPRQGNSAPRGGGGGGRAPAPPADAGGGDYGGGEPDDIPFIHEHTRWDRP